MLSGGTGEPKSGGIGARNSLSVSPVLRFSYLSSASRLLLSASSSPVRITLFADMIQQLLHRSMFLIYLCLIGLRVYVDAG